MTKSTAQAAQRARRKHPLELHRLGVEADSVAAAFFKLELRPGDRFAEPRLVADDDHALLVRLLDQSAQGGAVALRPQLIA